MKATRKAAAYFRVSHGDVTQKSLRAQLDEVKKLACSQGVEVVATFLYEDDGRSGRSIEWRPGMQRLLADAREGKFEDADISILYVWAIDRLGRNTTDVLNLQSVLAEHGVRLCAVRDQYQPDGSRPNRIRFVLDALIAEGYSEMQGRMSRRARQREALAGGFCSPTPPYGFSRNGVGPLLINPVEAGHLQEMYRLLISGVTRNRIVQSLKERGIRKRGGSLNWTIDEVTRHLKHEAVVGVRVYRGVKWDGKRVTKNKNRDEWIVVPWAHEQIVDLDTFVAAQRIIEERKANLNLNTTRRHFALLSNIGILRCGACGGAYASNVQARERVPGSEKPPSLKRRYVCVKRLRGQGCRGRSVRQMTLDGVVLGEVAKFVRDTPALLAAWKEARKSGLERLYPLRQRMEAVESEILEARGRQNRLLDGLERGKLLPQLFEERIEVIQERLRPVLAERRDISRQIEAFDRGFDEGRLLDLMSEFETTFGALPPESRKTLVGKLIKRVTIHGPQDFEIETTFLPVAITARQEPKLRPGVGRSRLGLK